MVLRKYMNIDKHNNIIIIVMFMIVTWLILDDYVCLCMLMFFVSTSDALCHKQTGSLTSLQHLGFRGYVKYTIDYFVMQLLSESDKQNVACLFKRQLLILSRSQN